MKPRLKEQKNSGSLPHDSNSSWAQEGLGDAVQVDKTSSLEDVSAGSSRLGGAAVHVMVRGDRRLTPLALVCMQHLQLEEVACVERVCRKWRMAVKTIPTSWWVERAAVRLAGVTKVPVPRPVVQDVGQVKKSLSFVVGALTSQLRVLPVSQEVAADSFVDTIECLLEAKLTDRQLCTIIDNEISAAIPSFVTPVMLLFLLVSPVAASSSVCRALQRLQKVLRQHMLSIRLQYESGSRETEVGHGFTKVRRKIKESRISLLKLMEDKEGSLVHSQTSQGVSKKVVYFLHLLRRVARKDRRAWGRLGASRLDLIVKK